MDEKSQEPPQGESSSEESSSEEDSEDEDVIIHMEEQEEEMDQEEIEDELEFERAYSSLVQESMDSRRFEKKTVLDIPIPLLRSQESGDNDKPESANQITFSLLTKRGNKQQLKSMALPSNSTFAILNKSVKEAEHHEKQELKRLVLSYEERERHAENPQVPILSIEQKKVETKRMQRVFWSSSSTRGGFGRRRNA